MIRSLLPVVVVMVLGGDHSFGREPPKPKPLLERIRDDQTPPDDVTKKVLELVNAEREKAKLPPVTLSEKLQKIARYHAVNMSERAEHSHTIDGQGLSDRLKRLGYEKDYSFVSENIAHTPAKFSAADVVEAWMKSDGHRKNILTADITEMGIAVAGNGDDDPTRLSRYWCLVFGKTR
jgi:uncharacterized protein YkwD